MRARLSAFSLLDLLVTGAASIVLLSLGIPTGARVRELSKRSTCAINLAGIGAAAKVYAASNNESWPVPAFRKQALEVGIIYTLHTGFGGDGQTGFERRFESTSETPGFPNAGSTKVAVTRAYWMLVRSGDVTVKQFICPSSGDTVDPTKDIDFYYDFNSIEHISYGYQVPFGPPDTRPREGMDHRQVVAADKGPWYLDPPSPYWVVGPGFRQIMLGDPPSLWRPFNSPNHGGRGSGEGQNTLFANGGVSFSRIPVVGVDNDNIYTLMEDRQWTEPPFGRIHGLSPTVFAQGPYPGQDALGNVKHSSTDSLIYP